MSKYQWEDLSHHHQKILSQLNLNLSGRAFTLDELNSFVIGHDNSNNENHTQILIAHLQEMQVLRRREQIKQATQILRPKSWFTSVFDTLKLGLLGCSEVIPYEFLVYTYYGIGHADPNHPSTPNTYSNIGWKEYSIVSAIFLMGAIRSFLGYLRADKAKNSAQLTILNVLLATLEEAFSAQTALYDKRREMLPTLATHDDNVGINTEDMNELEKLYQAYQGAYQAVEAVLAECQTFMPEFEAANHNRFLQVQPQTLQAQLKAMQAGKKTPNLWRTYLYDAWETFAEAVGMSGLWMLITTINPSYIWQDVSTLAPPWNNLWLYAVGGGGAALMFCYQLMAFGPKHAQSSAEDQAKRDFIGAINNQLDWLAGFTMPSELDLNGLSPAQLTENQQTWLGVNMTNTAILPREDSLAQTLSAFNSGLFPRHASDEESRPLLGDTVQGLRDGGNGRLLHTVQVQG